jgi:mycothiol synthase
MTLDRRDPSRNRAGTLGSMPEVRILDRFAPGDLRAVRRLADSVEAATGVPPFGETTWLGLSDGGTRHDVGLAVETPAGRLIGYAHAAEHRPGAWSLEAATTDSVSELSLLLAEAVVAITAHGGGEVTLWLHGPTDADDAAARGAGFTPERDLLEMRVPIPLPTPARWPEGVSVRSFVPGVDDDTWLAVNNRAFAGHPEQGGWDRATLGRRLAEPWFDPDGFLLAFVGDDLAGFCWTKIHAAAPPSEPAARGEIYVIGVDPARQAAGLGRALVTAGLDSLATRGVTVGMLFVDADNAAAVGLYVALGFTTHRVDRAYVRTVTS